MQLNGKLLGNQATTVAIIESLKSLSDAYQRHWSNEQHTSGLEFVELKGVGPVVVPANLRARVGKRTMEG